MRGEKETGEYRHITVWPAAESDGNDFLSGLIGGPIHGEGVIAAAHNPQNSLELVDSPELPDDWRELLKLGAELGLMVSKACYVNCQS